MLVIGVGDQYGYDNGVLYAYALMRSSTTMRP
jgi:hypothetical protein